MTPDPFTIQPVVQDPTFCEFDLPLCRTFYPLGFPLRLHTNSQHVLQAASRAWSEFTQEFDRTPVRMYLGVSESDATTLPPPSVFRSREHLMSFVADPENFMTCDFDRGIAFGWITPVVAANHAFLRYRFLSAAGLTLIGQWALAPLHAGLVSRSGSGVALFGESFAGKSTLAYACARAGWTYIADDGISLVRERSDRYAIGDPFLLRLREPAKQFFPELANHLAITRPNGKQAIEVSTKELPISLAAGASIDHIVFLNRNDPGQPGLRRFSKEDALLECEKHASYGAREVRAAQIRAYRRLMGAAVWELRYTTLDYAIERLDRLVDSGG